MEMRGRPWVVLALVGGLVGAVVPAAVGERQVTVEVMAKRTLMSAVANIAVGAGFVSGGELTAPGGRAKVGDGFSHCGVLSVSASVPPAITAHCTSTFKLQDGELHLSSLRTYKSLDAGFDDTTIAVVGGTGKYANVRGEGKVTRATFADRADVGYRFTFTLLER
ncbi:hypothetical protein GCM10010492_60170 [Saccharothrix mutabilis subsp. mutabilis]|uniref:Allene oxide cyclase barrel-like domain-containing protein n=2 Tax=Saccharothrix mutabilis TaxID=33921 RepID=A0ABP3E3U6_9PSEU